jgi:hypothetical protein
MHWSMVHGAEDGQRFRSRSQTWTFLVMGAFFGLLWGSQAFRSSVSPDAGAKAAFLTLAVATASTMIWCGLRPALIADESGVVVRNLISTERLAWSDIARFRIGRFKLLRAVCVIDLKDASSTHAFAIQVHNVVRGREVTRESRMMDDLNARLAQSTGHAR